MNQRKGFVQIIVISLIVLALAVGVGSFAAMHKNPTQSDQTANWKTYKNQKHRYEVAYPADGTLTFDDHDDRVTLKKGIAYVTICSIDDCGPGYGIGSRDKKIKENIDIDGNTYVAEGFVSGDPLYSSKFMDIEVQKNEVNTITYGYDMDGSKKLNNEEIKRADSLTRQILSTLKFTDNKADTADWKTCKNEKYGFEFKYPTTWRVLSEDSSFVVEYNGPQLKVTLTDLEHPTTGPDAELQGNSFILEYLPDFQNNKSCKMEEWQRSARTKPWGITSRREFCLQDHPDFTVTMQAIDRDSEIFPDKILSTFKFTK